MYADTNATVLSNNTNGFTGDVWIKFEFEDKINLAGEIILIFIAILTTLGNTLVLLVTWRERSLHEPNKYFIACLAVADLLCGIFVAPLLAYQHSLNESLYAMSIHLYRFTVWIDAFALTASIYSMTFISVDRYLKISKPLQYKSRMTASKSLKIIITIWLISTAFAFAILLSFSHVTVPFQVDENIWKGIITFLAISAFFLPIVVIFFMYTLIFIIAHKRQKRLWNGKLGETPNGRNQRTVLLQDLKVIRMLLIVVGVFILCWGPFFIHTLIFSYHPNFIIWKNSSLSYRRTMLTTTMIVRRLPYCNSLCNPVIYAFLDQKYKEAFKNFFKRTMCRRRNSRRQPPDTIELRQPRTI